MKPIGERKEDIKNWEYLIEVCLLKDQSYEE